MADSKLMLARDNIKILLDGLDIAGYFILYNAPGTVEVFSKLDTSFSNLTRDPPSAHGNTDAEYCFHGNDAQLNAFESTLKMVRCIAETLCWSGMHMLGTSDRLDAHFGIDQHDDPRTRGTEH